MKVVSQSLPMLKAVTTQGIYLRACVPWTFAYHTNINLYYLDLKYKVKGGGRGAVESNNPLSTNSLRKWGRQLGGRAEREY